MIPGFPLGGGEPGYADFAPRLSSLFIVIGKGLDPGDEAHY